MKKVYHHIAHEMKTQFPIQQVCKTLGITRSAYYEYEKGQTYKTHKDPCAYQVLDAFMSHRKRYGTRRLRVELQSKGIVIGRQRIGKLLKMQGLRAIQPKSFVPKTTNSKHRLGYAPNLLKTSPFPAAPNQVYVGDITYLPMLGGEWLYLSMWMDLFSREIVGWKIEERMEESIVIDSLCYALNKNPCDKHLIIHSDRGGQYAGKAFKNLAGKYRQSMSDADNPYDNAFAESFFSRFKAEVLEGGCFESKEDATIEIFAYIEGYYNTKRLHSALGYKAPRQYREEYERQNRCVSHKKNVEMMDNSPTSTAALQEPCGELPTFQHNFNNNSTGIEN